MRPLLFTPLVCAAVDRSDESLCRTPPADLHWRRVPAAVMFERFTVLARQALFCARFKAAERHCDNISTQNLLGGLMMAAPDGFRRGYD